MRTGALVAVLALAGVSLACGDEPGTDPPPVTEAGLQFGDGSQVWLQVSTGGGFVPEIVNLRGLPSFLLFDDGRVVRPLDETQSVLVPRLEQAQLDEATVAEVLDDTEDVVSGPDVGRPSVTDLPTTSIELRGNLRLDVYALGFDTGLTPSQQEARQAVADLIEDLDRVGDGEAFTPDEWLALTTATQQATDLDPSGVTTWPLSADRAADADHPRVCTRLTGSDADVVLAALADRGPSTYVRSGGTIVEIALRPVLTGDETCTDASGFVER
jgi:hypothetical protein